MSTKREKYGIIVILSLILCVAIFAVLFNYHEKHSFTVEKWNSLSYNDRQLLAKDFVKKYKNKNLTKNEIIDMLGLDTDFYKGFYTRYKTDNNLVYNFGETKTWFSFASGNTAMIIGFDDNDFAVFYNIIEYSW